MPRLFYRELGHVTFDGFVTKEQLTAEEAGWRRFKPMPPGTPWGAKWEYAWFRATIALPASAAGERIVLKTKKGNRVSEFALREAELWGAAASASAGFSFPLAKLGELWRAVLLNQFHDILPGSSIARVYAEDGSGDVVVRLYEAARCSVSCDFSTCLPVADISETNMLENTVRKLKFTGGKLTLSFKPFEIRTLRTIPEDNRIVLDLSTR